jgi:hydroxyacylglutathione hydrolase
METFKESIVRLQAVSDRFDSTWPAHHKLPLDHSRMDDYIQCAEQIMSGEVSAKSIISAVGTAQVVMYGRIAITYLPRSSLGCGKKGLNARRSGRV